MLGYQNVPRIFGLVDPPFCAAKSCNIPYTCEDMWVVLLPYYFHVRNPYSVWEDCGNGVQCPTSAELNFNWMVKADNWNGWSGKFIRKSWIGWKNTPWFLKIPVDSCFIRYLRPGWISRLLQSEGPIHHGGNFTDLERCWIRWFQFSKFCCSRLFPPCHKHVWCTTKRYEKQVEHLFGSKKKTENSYSIDAFKPCVRCSVGLKTGLTQAHIMAVPIYIRDSIIEDSKAFLQT